MKDIIINVDSMSHKVNFPDEFLGIGYENLQGNLIFQFDNNFIGGQARLDISIDCESGMIPNLTPYENGYILPIKSSLLTGSNVLMQLVIDEISLTQYSLTTDTEINPNKTYYEKVGNDYIIVENPIVDDISQYYEANTPVFKTDMFQLKVKDSINAQETIPEQYPTWINTLNTLIGTIHQKLGLVDTALTEMNNLNINVSGKVDGEVTITFTDKQGNQKEVKINDGRGIVSILKTSTSGNIDTYTITYTDDTTSIFEVTNGIDGTDGRGIVSIKKTGTTGLVDIYTITYTDNTTSTFNVANGKGITNIEKISTNLLIDTYRISFNDGATQDYEVTNGKGIVSIEKTSTSGYVDTYTITYNDGTTSTYEVTNGEVSQAQLDDLQDELNYYKTIVNALPKITGSGTSVTLNNTADSILSNVLNPSQLNQTTYTGSQLFNASAIANTSIVVNDNGKTIKMPIVTNGNGYTPTQVKLGVLCPTLQVGENVYLYFDRTPTDYNDLIYLENPSNFTWNNGTSKTITADMLNSNVVLYGNRYSSGETNQVTLSNFRIVRNSTDTFEPYVGGTASPNPSYPQNIHTISGDTDYSSEREDGAWYIKKNIGKIVLDGTESWLMDITSRFYITLDRLTGNTLGYCNYFENKPSLSTNNGITFYQTNQNIYIYYDGCTTTNDFKVWLSTHNTIVYYVLATSTYILLNDTLQSQLEYIYNQMLAYKGQTNISQVNNDLPFIIDSTALKDLTSL